MSLLGLIDGLGKLTLLDAIGWLGNGFYFSRFLIQWIHSERAGRSVAPRSFWVFSLLGSICLLTYSAHSEEPVLLAGYLINGWIYARNLWLMRASKRRLGQLRAAATGLVILSILLAAGVIQGQRMLARGGSAAPIWLGCVLLGQMAWSSRFVLQWWYSERKGHSHFPISFWWVSLAGNVMLLAYATIYIQKPVFIAGYSLGPLVQSRNLWLELKKRAGERAALRAVPPAPDLPEPSVEA